MRGAPDVPDSVVGVEGVGQPLRDVVDMIPLDVGGRGRADGHRDAGRHERRFDSLYEGDLGGVRAFKVYLDLLECGGEGLELCLQKPLVGWPAL